MEKKEAKNIYDVIVNINAMKSLLEDGWEEEYTE